MTFRTLRSTAGWAALLASSGCIETAEVPSRDDAITLLVVLPFTGTFAQRGESQKAAVQMAVQDLERGGELIPGRRVVLELVDSTSDKATAEARTRAAVDRLRGPGGALSVAAILSSSTVAHEVSLPVALDNGIPHFEISAGSPDDEFIDPIDHPEGAIEYAFSIRALCSEEAIMTADYIASRPDWRSIVLARGTKAHDLTHTRLIRERLGEIEWAGELDEEDLVMPYPDEDGHRPWRDHFEALAQGPDRPDAVFFHINGDANNLAVFEDLEAISFGVPFVTCGMSQGIPNLLNRVDPGVVDYLAGRVTFVTRGPEGSDELSTFKADLEELSGRPADTWAAGAYDATVLVGLAIAQVGGIDGAALRDAIVLLSRSGDPYHYGQVSEAIDRVRSGDDIDWQGASGSVDIRDDRTVPGKYRVDEILYDGGETGEYHTLDDPEPRVL
jgi:ABC-type branched-subunit amino acid transport system substrate-binding protein